MNIPPEEFIIDRNATDISDAKYVAHKSYMTVSQVREMGFDVDDDDLVGNSDGSTDGDSGALTIEQENRNQNSYGQQFNDGDNTHTDPANRRVLVLEEYCYVDADGDGIAELIKVIRIGDLILENMVVDKIPMASICPYPIPHTFYGYSVADQVIEIQFYSSMLYRGLLDNLEIANNGRYAVQESQVNLGDLLDNRPNAIVRCKAPPQQALMPMSPGTINPMTFQMLETLQASKAQRSGVPSMGAGLNGNELKSHAGSEANMEYMARADASLEQIARNFMSGFKRLYLGIYDTYRENSTSTEMMYNGFGTQAVAPAEWPSRDRLSVLVALGRNSTEQRAGKLKELLQLALTPGTPVQNLMDSQRGYNLLTDLLVLEGVKDYDRYLMNPEEAKQNPEKQAQQQQAQQQQQTAEQLAVAKGQAEIGKINAETEEIGARIGIDQEKLQLENIKAQAEIQLEATQGRPVDI